MLSSPPLSSPSNASLERPAVAQKPARLVYLDAFRGLMLVLMAVNHIPSDLRLVTDHPFGYMSAAEGFVFLSGLMAGLVYTRKWLRGGTESLWNACISRAFAIYRFHLGTFFAVFAGVVGYVMWTGELLPNAPLQIAAHPYVSLLTGPTLLLQPAMLDILPMYCAFILATPVLIQACDSGRRKWVVGGAFLLWAFVNAFCAQAPMVSPYTSGGALNICAWQLPFVIGLVFGHAWSRGDSLLRRPTAALLPLTVGAAFVLFTARHSWLALPIPSDVLNWLTNKNNLAPLRLANTALLFWLIYGAVTLRPHWFSWRPLAFLGQASLPVFTAHVLVAYVVHANPAVFDSSSAGRALGTIVMLSVMIATAAWVSRSKAAAGARKPTRLVDHSKLASQP